MPSERVEQFTNTLGRYKDRIDLQSFIWVVGSYTDAELPNAQSVK